MPNRESEPFYYNVFLELAIDSQNENHPARNMIIDIFILDIYETSQQCKDNFLNTVMHTPSIKEFTLQDSQESRQLLISSKKVIQHYFLDSQKSIITEQVRSSITNSAHLFAINLTNRVNGKHPGCKDIIISFYILFCNMQRTKITKTRKTKIACLGKHARQEDILKRDHLASISNYKFKGFHDQ